MKNFRLMVAICSALMIAAPAMALDVEVSGHYFVEHFNHSNQLLRESDVTDDYTTMELMVKPVFKINDNITLTTQFTALQDHVWGTDASQATDVDPLSPKMDNNENFDWKAAYMTIKSPIGGSIIGRYIDTPWGTGLGDSTSSHGSNSRHKDRIMWVAPIGNFISGLVAQKNGEGDKGNIISDADFHKYYGFSAYKQENWSTGLLIARYEHKNFVSVRDLRNFQMGYGRYTQAEGAATVAGGTFSGTYNAARTAEDAGLLAPFQPAADAAGYPTPVEWDLNLPGAQLGAAGVPDLWALNDAAVRAQGNAAVAGAAVAAGPKRSTLGLWLFDPYFMGTFGPFTAEAEFIYAFGEVQLDETRTYEGESFNSIDASAILATLNLKYDIAGLTLNAGGTYYQGDSNPDDDESNATGYFEQSIDLEHGFLLTSDTQNLHTTLGGTDENGIPLGNLTGGPTTITGPAGYQSFWVGAKYQLLDSLNLGVLYVESKADDVPKTNAGVEWDDDHGAEYDFTLEWNIMQNLKFWGVVAYLDAGDYWKAGGYNPEPEDNTTIYGRLTLEF